MQDKTDNLLKITKNPNDFITLPDNVLQNEPSFDEVDNPGGWDSFAFWSNF